MCQILYIYIIQDALDLKIYIGQTDNPKERWGKHKSEARKFLNHPEKSSTIQKIDRAMAKNGIENFTFKIIEEWTTQKEVDNAEEFWIEFFESRKEAFGYNRSSGGRTGRGWTHSEEVRKKMSRAKERLPWPDAAKLLQMSKQLTATEIATQLSFNLGVVCKKIQRIGGIILPNKHTKISAKQVLELVDLYKSGTKTKEELAIEFDISATHIVQILKGRRWSTTTKIQPEESSYLSKDEVLEIVKLCLTSNLTQKEIGIMFGVHSTSINNIMLGKCWSNTTGIIDPIYSRRSTVAENNGNATLTNDDAVMITKLYAIGNHSQRQLAKQFNVGKTTIARVLKGMTFSSITGITDAEKIIRPSTMNKKSGKITGQNVLCIIELHKNGFTKPQLAEQFSVSCSTIQDILVGRCWSQITGIKKQERQRITK